MSHPMVLRVPPLAGAALVAAVLSSCAAARTWTDVQGRPLDAELVSSDGTTVTLKMPGGKTATLALSRLSQGDRDFVQDAVESRKAGAALNFSDPWPGDVRFDGDPEIRIVAEEADAHRFVYESANFRFVCDVRLSKQVVKGFAVLFEASQKYCRALPLAMTGGNRTDGKLQVLLFETTDAYERKGGPPGSAGVFIGEQDAVLVPLTSLGVEKVGNGYMLNRDVSNRTLIHELTHQLTPPAYFGDGAMGWFTEGIAEYVAVTPYRSGRFSVRTNLDDIVAYVTDYAKDDSRGRAIGREFKAPPLQKFCHMPYEEFTGNSGNFNYGFALILTTYFLHMDGERDAARIKAFLKALRDGKDGQQALDVLLDGRSYRQLEESVAAAWNRRGVKITFKE